MNCPTCGRWFPDTDTTARVPAHTCTTGPLDNKNWLGLSIIETAQTTRTAQKAYYSTRPQTPEKRDALIVSKQAEAELDRLLKQWESTK